MKTDWTRNDDMVCEIRIAMGIRPEQVETVLDMAAQSGLFTEDSLMAVEDMAWDSAYGDGHEPHTFIMATSGEQGGEAVVGFLIYTPIDRWPGEFELFGIAVDENHRRMGIGSALISEMKRQIQLTDGRQIFLETGTSRNFEGARLFYEALGFDPEHRHCKQFIPLDGGMVYRLRMDFTDDNKYH